MLHSFIKTTKVQNVENIGIFDTQNYSGRDTQV